MGASATVKTSMDSTGLAAARLELFPAFVCSRNWSFSPPLSFPDHRRVCFACFASSRPSVSQHSSKTLTDSNAMASTMANGSSSMHNGHATTSTSEQAGPSKQHQQVPEPSDAGLDTLQLSFSPLILLQPTLGAVSLTHCGCTFHSPVERVIFSRVSCAYRQIQQEHDASIVTHIYQSGFQQGVRIVFFLLLYLCLPSNPHSSLTELRRCSTGM